MTPHPSCPRGSPCPRCAPPCSRAPAGSAHVAENLKVLDEAAARAAAARGRAAGGPGDVPDRLRDRRRTSPALAEPADGDVRRRRRRDRRAATASRSLYGYPERAGERGLQLRAAHRRRRRPRSRTTARPTSSAASSATHFTPGDAARRPGRARRPPRRHADLLRRGVPGERPRARARRHRPPRWCRPRRCTRSSSSPSRSSRCGPSRTRCTSRTSTGSARKGEFEFVGLAALAGPRRGRPHPRRPRRGAACSPTSTPRFLRRLARGEPVPAATAAPASTAPSSETSPASPHPPHLAARSPYPMTSTVPTRRPAQRRQQPPITMFGPDFPYAYDDFLAHPAGPRPDPGDRARHRGRGHRRRAVRHRRRVRADEDGPQAGRLRGRPDRRPAAHRRLRRLRPGADRRDGRDALPAVLDRALQHYIDLVGLETAAVPQPARRRRRPRTVVDLKGESHYAETHRRPAAGVPRGRRAPGTRASRRAPTSPT